MFAESHQDQNAIAISSIMPKLIRVKAAQLVKCQVMMDHTVLSKTIFAVMLNKNATKME